MIFQRKRGIVYGFSKRKFLESERLVKAYSRIPNFVDNEGYTGPFECGGIDLKSSIAVKKAFSESLERRAVTLGAHPVSRLNPDYEKLYYDHFGLGDQDDKYALSYDLVNKRPALIPKVLTAIRMINPYNIDTTGTAAHYQSDIAVMNAVKELLEKNAVYSFWYGLKGQRLEKNYSDHVFSHLKNLGYDLQLFVVDMFAPFSVVILAGQNPDHYTSLKYIFGVGSGFDLNEAIRKAAMEAYMLRSYYNVVFFKKEWTSDGESNPYENILFNELHKEDTEAYMKNFEQLPLLDRIDDLPENEDIQSIVKTLPEWVSQLYITILPQTLKKELIVVKAFSPDLINHIPQKSLIDLNVSINQRFLQLSQETFDSIPDCPII